MNHQMTHAEAVSVIAEKQNEIESLRAKLAEVTDSREWHKRRCDLLQKWQSKMRDPERTIVCDILANGQTLNPAGYRYTVKPDEQLLATQAHAARMVEALEFVLSKHKGGLIEATVRSALSTPTNLDALHELQGNAARWQYARQFLSIEDVEAWAGPEWKGHQPTEEESSKADATVDSLISANRAKKEVK